MILEMIENTKKNRPAMSRNENEMMKTIQNNTIIARIKISRH